MSDNIIQFPGPAPEQNKPEQAAEQQGTSSLNQSLAAMGLPNLTADQEKAMQVVMSGMSFVCIGISPTDGGADFFTAVQGDAEHLRNAQAHLEGVIERAFDKRGI